MKKRAMRPAPSRKTPRTQKAAAKPAAAKKPAKRRPETSGTGWPPFRYPPQ